MENAEINNNNITQLFYIENVNHIKITEFKYNNK